MEKRYKKWYLPHVDNTGSAPHSEEPEVIGDAPCPCCGFITIPNGGDALAYICPVCFWEIDTFVQSEKEPSDQNHGLSLFQARKNYIKYGSTLPELKALCRSPKASELPGE